MTKQEILEQVLTMLDRGEIQLESCTGKWVNACSIDKVAHYRVKPENSIEWNVNSSFLELVEKAYKAALEDKIEIHYLSSTAIHFQLSSGGVVIAHSESDSNYSLNDSINFIESINVEKFTIESLEQFLELKVKPSDIVTLSNGEVLTSTLIKTLLNYSINLTYPILKGATVERVK